MKDLTDEQLNIALCEWLGWTNIKREIIKNVNAQGDDVFIGLSGKHENNWASMPWLPNHITGIEALGHIHEAEKRLGPSKAAHSKYWIELHNLVAGESPEGVAHHWQDWRATGHATARQRAIALLRVVRPELFL